MYSLKIKCITLEPVATKIINEIYYHRMISKAEELLTIRCKKIALGAFLDIERAFDKTFINFMVMLPKRDVHPAIWICTKLRTETQKSIHFKWAGLSELREALLKRQDRFCCWWTIARPKPRSICGSRLCRWPNHHHIRQIWHTEKDADGV